MAKVELKKPIVEEIQSSIKDAKSVVVVDYRGLTVEQDTKLRKTLRENNVTYKVYKNTMINFAIKGTEFESLAPYHEGPTAIAISTEDATAPARVICKFAKEAPKLEVKAGVVEGQAYDANGIAKNIGLEQSRGDYIWFVDGDDWLLGTDAYDTILDAMKEDHAHRMQVQFATNGWQNQSEYTIWQHVFSREFLHGLRFSRMAHSSDVYFMAKAFEKEKSIQGLPPVRLTKQKYYYYYYGRPGAVTTQVRETGKVES